MFSKLRGKTVISIEGGLGDSAMKLYTLDSLVFELYHDQDCCESVSIEDICGDLSDLLFRPILSAEEVVSNDNPPTTGSYSPDSFTWTFYKLSTIKGSVTIRWYGESNGYYSESVDVSIERVKEDEFNRVIYGSCKAVFPYLNKNEILSSLPLLTSLIQGGFNLDNSDRIIKQVRRSESRISTRF